MCVSVCVCLCGVCVSVCLCTRAHALSPVYGASCPWACVAVGIRLWVLDCLVLCVVASTNLPGLGDREATARKYTVKSILFGSRHWIVNQRQAGSNLRRLLLAHVRT